MPAPKKDPTLRARSNTASTAAELVTSEPVVKPDLPALYDDDGNEIAWHVQARAFWDDYWASPMAEQLFVSVDRHRLFVIVDLLHRYWSGDKSLAGELRLQCKDFGTTPGERNSLEWKLTRLHQPAPLKSTGTTGRGRRAAGPTGAKQPPKRKDPRLSLVKP